MPLSRSPDQTAPLLRAALLLLFRAGLVCRETRFVGFALQISQAYRVLGPHPTLPYAEQVDLFSYLSGR